MRIGIVGAGNIGATLGEIWAGKGHEVMFGVRGDREVPAGCRRGTVAEAAAFAEVVVLAVPGRAIQDAVQEAGDLSGKILVDCTNFSRDGGKSGAEQIAGWASGARVVKSFNQTGWEVLRNPEFRGERALMCVAGDDASAKDTIMGLGREVGLDMVDAGPLSVAGLLESFAELWIQLAIRQGQGRDIAFALLRR